MTSLGHTALSIPVRERLIEAATQITTEHGWTAVTMSKVANHAGVSRQTVYNELGSKPALGQAMVLRELERFLAVVADELDAHDDVVEAIRSAAVRILEMAQDNRLLHAVLSSAHAADGASGSNDLLPFLTTDAEPLLMAASAVIEEHVAPMQLGLTSDELAAAIDAIVRLVLSHVMQPGGKPGQTADRIAWIAARVLQPPPPTR